MTPSQQKRIDSITPERLIEWSKGLSNEGALITYVHVQDSISKAKDKIISDLLEKEKKYIKQEEESLQKEREFLDKIGELNDKLAFANNRISDLNDEKLGIQKAKSNNGIYILGEFGNGYSVQDQLLKIDYKHVFFGVQLVKSKMIYGFKINPVNDEMIYAGSVSFKLF